MQPLTPILESTENGLLVWLMPDELESVWVVPMYVNDRIVIGTTGDYGYSHGWCYDKGGAALIAALVWDPRTQDAPVGFKKQATPGRRVAPRA